MTQDSLAVGVPVDKGVRPGPPLPTPAEVLRLVNRYTEACDDLGAHLFEQTEADHAHKHARARAVHEELTRAVQALHEEATKARGVRDVFARWMAEALLTLETIEADDSDEERLIEALIARGDRLVRHQLGDAPAAVHVGAMSPDGSNLRARLDDALFVLGMVDKNNRIDAGEKGKAWSGRFVADEVRRVLDGKPNGQGQRENT